MRDGGRRGAAAVLACVLLLIVAGITRTAPYAVAGNGLALTPPMGVNEWNALGCGVDAALVEQTADRLLASGLAADGYRYVNIDDCWQAATRSESGHLQADPVKFPGGIAAVAAYVHARGLRLGIYSDAGGHTCAGRPGSLGHEQTDADDFAAWGVDYLKYDNCYSGSDGSLIDYRARFAAMGQALARTSRKIVYSVCEWGVDDPAGWAGDVGNLWRTTDDIADSWASVKSIIAANVGLAGAARPGAWNDPDMLEVGNGGMTDTEYRTHFSMWAEMAAPLLIGTDLRDASRQTLAIFGNRDAIAIDQDRLGAQGRVVAREGSDGSALVLAKPLTGGAVAVALYNPTDSPLRMTTDAQQAGLPLGVGYRTLDVWTRARGCTSSSITATVAPHATVLLRVTAVPAASWHLLTPIGAEAS